MVLKLAWTACLALVSCGLARVQADEPVQSSVPARGTTATRPSEGQLLTRWAKEVTPDRTLPEYPRPQLVRPRWLNLNGLWEYAITPHQSDRPAAWDGNILVPFPVESALSGVKKALRPEQRLWYRRTFSVPEDWAGGRVLLHFGAADWHTTVYVNGRLLGSHRGGYDGFTFDLTSALRQGEAQELVVSIWDPTDTSWQLHGKQSMHPTGCSYTASSGIWQTVWLEPVPLTSRIEAVAAVPDLDAGLLRLKITGRVGNKPLKLEARVLEGGRSITSAAGVAGIDSGPACVKTR